MTGSDPVTPIDLTTHDDGEGLGRTQLNPQATSLIKALKQQHANIPSVSYVSQQSIPTFTVIYIEASSISSSEERVSGLAVEVPPVLLPLMMLPSLVTLTPGR